MRLRDLDLQVVGLSLAMICLEAGPASAAGGGLFPAEQKLLPLLVGAAFALPALLAGLYSAVFGILRRLGRTGTVLASIGGGVATVAWLQPSWVKLLGL